MTTEQCNLKKKKHFKIPLRHRLLKYTTPPDTAQSPSLRSRCFKFRLNAFVLSTLTSFGRPLNCALQCARRLKPELFLARGQLSWPACLVWYDVDTYENMAAMPTQHL